MRPVDVLNNIKGNDFDISGYSLNKAEADVVVEALSQYISNGEVTGKICPVCGREYEV